MEHNNLDSKYTYIEVQTKKKIGFRDGVELDFTSLEMEKKRDACENKSGYWVEERIPEEEGNMKETGVLDDFVGGCDRNNVGLVDEVCPICFDKFNIPCRTNCGHWFCAGCIMQVWMYTSSIRQCKCPLCCCIIDNLAPEMSQNVLPTDDDVEVLKKVRQYNGLVVGGIRGLFLGNLCHFGLQKVLALPLLMSRIVRSLIAPDGMRCTYYVLRLLGEDLGFRELLTLAQACFSVPSFLAGLCIDGCSGIGRGVLLCNKMGILSLVPRFPSLP
ncbi:hypothetical protein F511_05349 [Dorcoceras hygrometricum]|uniref:RING-type domain-containing protein n=1 Tax=Dorcoceras hygrometricum TaxID=472368 RepID=A0A2Z7ATP3_9LAMI|nr:hypothetical protein F511_05349 [Dorcoceras hygrometricum]